MRPLSDVSVSTIAAAVNLPALITETHAINREDKTLCPFHADTNPSCHVYRERFKCFSCGAHGDAIDWLEQVHYLSKADAVSEAKRRAGMMSSQYQRKVQIAPTPAAPKACESLALNEKVVTRFYQQMEKLERVPPAVAGRGFSFEDCQALMIAEVPGAAVFMVYSPQGEPIALKRRYTKPFKGMRYQYKPAGHGAPAWCSPSYIVNADHPPDRVAPFSDVLIIEGELNAMACYLARPELAVMGVAGSNGRIHFDGLKDCTVYVYADPDEAGDKARKEWARAAFYAGAKKVYQLPAWAEGDACDIAGTLGRDELRGRLS